MADTGTSPSLAPWLQEVVEAQLLLGNAWLRDKHAQKHPQKHARRLEFNRAWDDLYRDSGSCLEITNLVHSDQRYHLRVVQTSPLTVTDGLTSTPVLFAANALPHLTSLSPGALLAVRKYTIRYTSYGPPSDKLRCILHAVDWLGTDSTHIAPTSLKPLRSSEEIASALRKLHQARLDQDRRCLRPQPESKVDPDTHDQLDKPVQHEDEPHDDIPVQHDDTPIMAPSDDADVGNASFNTQHAYGTQLARPVRARPVNDEVEVLGVNRLEPILAGNTKRAELRPQALRPKNTQREALLSLLKKSGNNPQPHPAESAPPQTPLRRSPQPRVNITEHPAVSPRLNQSNPQKRASPVPNEHQETPRQPDKPKVHKLDKLAAECSWMKGLQFTRESTMVPKDQSSILNMPESWHKPQPGYRFPPANIPVSIFTTLSRLADEKAAMDASSGSEGMDIDPSPDSYPTTGEQPSHPVAQTDQDDPPTSVLSWSPSPVLSPQRPAGQFNELPPDSSFDALEATKDLQPAERLPSLPPDSSYDDVKSSMDVSPQLTRGHQQQPRPQQPVAIVSSNKPAPEAPRSSPPVIELSSSDEMEMETSVPYALGQDSAPRQKSVVQVEETPHAKGKNIHTLPSSPVHKRTSCNGSHNTSSASIIHDTCNAATTATAQDRRDKESLLRASTQVQPPPMTSQRDKVTNQVKDVQTSNKQSSDRQPAPAQTPISAQIPPKDSSSGEPLVLQNTHIALPTRSAISPNPLSPAPSLAKRKLDDSPSKGAKRKSKRREIKIVGFGDTPEKVVVKLDEDAEMRDIPQAEDVPVEMSPRHRSLYDTPPVEERPVGRPAPASTSTPRPDIVAKHTIPGTQYRSDRGSSPITANITHPDTIFQRFKAAYPEYTGDEKHFTAQCRQMLELDDEDKMVPKWQWDDYLIRNRTDYKDYVMQCLDQGENFEPHYRFYKDNIRDTIYVKGILDTRAALATALAELIPAPAPAAFAAPPPPQPKKPTRTSLPWSPHHRPAIPQPRPSLPLSTTPTPSHASPRPAPTPRPSPLVRQTTDKTPPTATTGDAYRDYVFAAMRTTSWTGSTRVDATAAWPRNLAGRTSIKDVARRAKVDVLKWGDVL